MARRLSIATALIIAVWIAGVDATVSAKLWQLYVATKDAINEVLKKPCIPQADFQRLDGMVEHTEELINEAIADDQKKEKAIIDKNFGRISRQDPPLKQLDDEISELRRMRRDLDDLFAKVYGGIACPMSLVPDPPPPPPPPQPPKPPIPPPPGGVKSEPHHRATNCPKCTKEAADLNKAIDALVQAQNANAPNQQDLLAEVQRLARVLSDCEEACATAPKTASIMKRPAMLGAIGGGAAIAAVAIAHGGGSDAANTSTTTPSSFFPFNAVMTGTMTLVTDAKTCAGSSSDYPEKATVALNKNESGTVQLEAAYVRVYHAVVVNNAFTDSETFPYLGLLVPSSATGTFTFASASSGTLTLQETSNWGSGSAACTNVYRGTLK